MKKLFIMAILLIAYLTLFGNITPREVTMDYIKDSNLANFLKAHSYLTIAAEKDSVQDIAHFYLMTIHQREADKYLNLLMENLENKQPGMKFSIANALLASGKPDEAIKIYEQLNSALPDWSCPWRHKGEAHLMQRDYANAEIALKKSIETRTTHYDAYLMLADAYFRQNKNKLALETIEKAFEVQGIDTEDPEEVYTFEETDFLYLKILKANKHKKARDFEAGLREKYPENEYWK